MGISFARNINLSTASRLTKLSADFQDSTVTINIIHPIKPIKYVIHPINIMNARITQLSAYFWYFTIIIKLEMCSTSY